MPTGTNLEFVGLSHRLADAPYLYVSAQRPNFYNRFRNFVFEARCLEFFFRSRKALGGISSNGASNAGRAKSPHFFLLPAQSCQHRSLRHINQSDKPSVLGSHVVVLVGISGDLTVAGTLSVTRPPWVIAR